MLNIIFFVLFVLIWIMAVGFIVYAYFYHEQQRKVLRYIAVKLSLLSDKNTARPTPAVQQQDTPEQPQPAPHKTKMTIDKNEPISKYESMTLPDEVDVTFK